MNDRQKTGQISTCDNTSIPDRIIKLTDDEGYLEKITRVGEKLRYGQYSAEVSLCRLPNKLQDLQKYKDQLED